MENDAPPAHPLTIELIETLRPQSNARVADFGTGRGRNASALRAAGFSVSAIADDRVHAFAENSTFDAIISTHALLHGGTREIETLLEAVALALKPRGLLYATFGSTSDARYGKGERIDANAFAPSAGDEQGVPHAYFDQPSLRTMLERRFVIDAVEERRVDEVVGSWAHARRPQGSVHWIVRAHLSS